MLKVLAILMFISNTAYAYVDLNLSYTLSMRKVEGVETDENPDPGSAMTTTTGYLINWAWFMWEYTALEFNYSKTTQRVVDDREVTITDDGGDPFIIQEVDQVIITEVNGIGIRQAFANRKAKFIPSLAIGYAQYTTSGSTKYTTKSNDDDPEVSEQEQDQEVFSSSYASISIRYKFTQLMGLTLAAKTIMPDFDTAQASSNVTYSAGFSWMF